MDTRSKSRIKALITKVILNIYCLGIKKSVNDHFEDTLDSLHGSIAQTPQPGPSTSTTPKVSQKLSQKMILSILIIQYQILLRYMIKQKIKI